MSDEFLTGALIALIIGYVTVETFGVYPKSMNQPQPISNQAAGSSPSNPITNPQSYSDLALMGKYVTVKGGGTYQVGAFP